jgi:hypothetical protein
MDPNTEHKGLSDDELYALIDEIENEDDDLAEDVAAAESKLAEEETMFEDKDDSSEIVQSGELPENLELEAEYGEDAWRMINEDKPILYNRDKAVREMARGRKLKKYRIAQEKSRIQREAFNQTLLPLDKPMGSDNVKLLLRLLVSTHTEIIDKCENYINDRFTKLLRPYVPNSLKNCMRNYPNSIKRSVGFLYTTSEMPDGQTYSFYVQPNLPCYFEQNTEPSVIVEEGKEKFLKNIDKAVRTYNLNYKERAQKEIRYATRIVNRDVVTYFDLLKLNPYWFERLLHHVQNTNTGLPEHQ